MMLSGVFLGVLICLAVFAHNYRRSRQNRQWELKPNCLMTRHPLLFMTGRRSMFYFMSYWNQIPDFLAQHGYDITLLSLNWNNTRIRQNQISEALHQLEKARQKVHLFIDSTTLSEIVFLLSRRDFESLASVTLIGKHAKLPPYRLKIPIYELSLPANSSKATPWFWWLHEKLTFQFALHPEADPLTHLGWQLTEERGFSILERVQELAERDLLQNQASPNLRS